MIMPLTKPKITSPYGVIRSNGKLHKGIDIISTNQDRDVKAIQGGTYRGAFYDQYGFGNYVVVQHDDGIRAIYAHLESTANIEVGKRIEERTILGREGTTGNSTGIHLHLELRVKPYGSANHIDVAEYLGIENKTGLVQEKLTKEKAMEIVQSKTGFGPQTMDYLDGYEWNTDLFIKLAKAMN